MPSLTLWAERDIEIESLEKYSSSSAQAINILIELWLSNSNALTNMAQLIETHSMEQDDDQVLSNYLEDKVSDRVTQALLQYGRAGTPAEAQHIRTLRRCLVEHEQRLPTAFAQLKGASVKMTQISSELANARKSKTDADQQLLSAVTAKSELEKRYTASATGASKLPTSVVNIMNKCEERIRAAQESQMLCGQRVTELREQLEDVMEDSLQSRKDSLQIVENVEKKKLSGIAATSTELMNLHLVLSAALDKETAGIVEPISAPKNSLNMSTTSSVVSSAADAAEWVERILAMDPADRSLFQLGQIAEQVASIESEEEVKISDLEREIEKIKAQIRELESGTGSFADRLAADYQGARTDASNKLPSDPKRVTSKFSLPLPLKTDCYAKNFWAGFANEERHATDVDPLVDASGLSAQDWALVVYEQVLLGYFEINSRFPHLLSQSQWNKLKAVVNKVRVKLAIPSNQHDKIAALLLPDSVAISDEIGPLDFRFRLCRLFVTPTEETALEHAAFVKRQVMFLDFEIKCLMKEDESGFVETHVSPLIGALVSSIDHLPHELLVELLETLGTYAEETLETTQLMTPRGVIHEIISRIWKLCVDPNEETGLATDVNVIASFAHNFLTTRQYPYHHLWLALALWDHACSLPAVPAAIAKQINEILKSGSGDKWLDKLAGDSFWFGKNAASSIHSALSPRNASFRPETPTARSDLTSRVIGFDLAFFEKMTCSSRDSIVAALCDYRRSLEPEALEVTIDLFRNLMLRTNVVVPPFLWPSELDLQQFFKAMGEFFISESARSTCNRLIEPEKFLDSVAVARAHASDESRGLWIGDVAAAVWKVIFEFTCEIEIYALAWTKSDLTFKHKLIWCKGLQRRIRSVVDLMSRDDDLWPPDRVPPGGQDLLAVLQVWERISADSGLTEIIRPKIARSLSLHLDRVERDSVPSCLHNNHGEDCWQATRPPTGQGVEILHSTKCVDLWTTVFTAMHACVDSASAQMAMATCARMIVRCVERYCDNAREGFMSDLGYAHPLLVKARRCFNRLIRNADDETELPELFKAKKKRKNRLFKRDSSNAQQAGQSGEDSDDQVKRTASTGGSLTGEGLNLIGDNHLYLSDYLIITSRLASHEDTTLMVRLHDVIFSLGELEKARATLQESIEKEHQKLAKLYKSQTKEVVSGQDVLSLPKLPQESTKALQEAIDAGVSEATEILISTAELVATYMGVNLVLLAKRDDLFERLYMPTARDCTLASILKSYKAYIPFILMTPLRWRTGIARAVVENFVLSWTYVVADMTARGRVFKEPDAAVMNNDLTALHQLADDLGLRNDLETQDVLRSVGCLPVYVSGSTPAEFKANCERALAEPTEKSKAKSRLAKTAPPPVVMTKKK